MSSLLPLPFSYGRVEYVDLSNDHEFSDDAMEEVNLLSLEGRARYTVYRIADATKRVIHDNEVPVFQKQVHGSGDWVTLTPSEIWYPVGYILLSTPLNSDDLVRVHTGHYCTSYQLFGCASRAPTDKTVCGDCTCDSDTATKRAPLYDDWSDRLEAFYAKMRSELTTTGGAANSHIKLQHLDGGPSGDDISFEITNPGGSGSLSISVAGSDISVVAARSGGVITSTARDVIGALNSNADVQALKVLATVPAGEDGTGLVSVFSHTHLSGGLDEINYASLKGATIIVKYYDNYSAGVMRAGFAIIEAIDWAAKPKDFVKATLTISGARNRLYRVSA